jgi:hypothetical protein
VRRADRWRVRHRSACCDIARRPTVDADGASGGSGLFSGSIILIRSDGRLSELRALE